MDRKQKIQKLSNQDKVSKISDLHLEIKYIDPRYKLEPCDGIIGETGKLEVLKLVADLIKEPYFVARWDQRAEHLDIDMKNATKVAVRKFKNGIDGYAGHHTDRTINPKRRVFEINIGIPERAIFHGEVSFSNTYDAHICMHAHATMTTDATVIRAKSKQSEL